MFLAVVVCLAGCAYSADHPLKPVSEWTSDHAAHLLRRAGFGGTPEQVEFLTQLGRDKAVDYLINYETIAFEPVPVRIDDHPVPPRRANPGADRAELQQMQARLRRADQLQLQRISQWWIETMVSTPRPLQEKMVLFWHGHLTSGHREVKSSRAMYFQNELFRKHAIGNFRDILLAVSEDPAMILYLNTQQNVRGKPNENYARELLELFAVGEGRYTERDIKEAARAFTGIKVNPLNGQTVYLPGLHDFGTKQFMGRTGDFDPAAIIDILLDQPATAEHMAQRLWTFFACEDPEPAIVKGLAVTLRNARYDFKPMLRRLLRSSAFYSERAVFTHIKSPVELMVGTARMLEQPPQDTTVIERSMRQMGQQLFQPPNVKGWDGGAAWITTSTLYNRYNGLANLIYGTDNPEFRQRRRVVQQMLEESTGNEAMTAGTDELLAVQPAYDPSPVVASQRLETPERVVDHFIERLLQRTIDPARRKILLEAFVEELDGVSVSDPEAQNAIRGLLHLIVSMPEYQLS